MPVVCSARLPFSFFMALVLGLFAPEWVGGQSQASAPGWVVGQSQTSTIVPASPATTSLLRDLVERYSVDRAALGRRYAVSYSPSRQDRFRAFYREWAQRLDSLDYDALGVEERLDYHLLNNEVAYQQELLNREELLTNEMRPFLPFAADVMNLEEERRRFRDVDPEGAAALLAGLTPRIQQAQREMGRRVASGEASRVVALRSEGLLRELRRVLAGWYEHYAGYDPMFTWWVASPYRSAEEAMDGYARFLRTEVVGQKPGEDEPIVGDPIGAAGMAADLAYEMIPYTPEELIAIGNEEFAWCEEEMLKASRELGFGEDWKAALEHVKTLHVPPGRQPALVRDLAVEAVEFLEARDLITIPELAKEIWRLEMMSPEAQKVSPFFLGGETIRVSFPTDAMSHDEKLQSMRGNNEHFARATVQHELIPGHGLQRFMYTRYNPHRAAFNTPFWIEGNALYWEMLLWDLDFPRGPEDRVGMLFWRMHRAARIVFSLSFHLGTMTPGQAIDFLVDRVGHERANATAEVRRSFNGSYSPLYQAAYMLGGLQLMALRRELVDSGTMTDKDFHDAIMTGGIMPIELVRARLSGALLPRDYRPGWRFADGG